MHVLAYQDAINVIEILVTTLIVIIIVTAYFMSLHREARLRQGLVDLAEERDDLLRALPEDTQIMIVSGIINSK